VQIFPVIEIVKNINIFFAHTYRIYKKTG
jgi:hypothetical protein